MSKIPERIATLEANYQELRSDIADIRDNHLKDLDSKLDRLQLLIMTSLLGIVIELGVMLWK